MHSIAREPSCARTKLCSSQKRTAARTLRAMRVDRLAKSLPRARLVKERRQAAAVCYRMRKRGIEFLLVQTRGGRWIFPKGGVEPGLTHAHSAALEAFEEAGVHGRIEEIPFARYFWRRPDAATGARSDGPEIAVTAHLCEVARLETPQESDRNPTWFSAEKAKQRLLQGRMPELGAELARVVDRASARIRRLHGARNIPDRRPREGLQAVRFEAFEDGRLPEGLKAALVREFLRQRRGAPQQIRRAVLRLGAGASPPVEPVHNVTAIDSGRRTNPPAGLAKSGNSPSSKHKAAGKLVQGRRQNR